MGLKNSVSRFVMQKCKMQCSILMIDNLTESQKKKIFEKSTRCRKVRYIWRNTVFKVGENYWKSLIWIYTPKMIKMRRITNKEFRIYFSSLCRQTGMIFKHCVHLAYIWLCCIHHNMQVDEELALTFTSDARILPYALQNFSLFKSLIFITTKPPWFSLKFMKYMWNISSIWYIRILILGQFSKVRKWSNCSKSIRKIK